MQKRSDLAIEISTDVKRRFGQAQEPALQRWVAHAMVNRGFVLTNLARLEEAIAPFEEVERRFGQPRETAVREVLARAEVGKGRAWTWKESFEALADELE